jgi:protein-tyrosine phosphatase
MAEGVFRHLVKQEGLEDWIDADSAGTGHWHLGEPPHHGTRGIFDRHGIAYEGCSRLIRKRDLDDFDYVITMDKANYRDVLAMGKGSARIAPLLSFAPETGVEEVPDPYYTGNFDEVHALVDAACRRLPAHIREERGL